MGVHAPETSSFVHCQTLVSIIQTRHQLVGVKCITNRQIETLTADGTAWEINGGPEEEVEKHFFL